MAHDKSHGLSADGRWFSRAACFLITVEFTSRSGLIAWPNPNNGKFNVQFYVKPGQTPGTYFTTVASNSTDNVSKSDFTSKKVVACLISFFATQSPNVPKHLKNSS